MVADRPSPNDTVSATTLAVTSGAVYCLSGTYYQVLPPGGISLVDGLTVGVYDSGGTSNCVDANGRSYGTSEPYIYTPTGDWRRWAFYFVANKSSIRVQLLARSGSLTYLDDVKLQRVYRWLRYEPRLVKAPQASESRRDKFFGPWQVGSARLDLANDGTLETTFGALDAITRTQIRHDLEVLWMETHKTVLFITHSLEEAIGLSDRVLVMSPRPGRIVDEIRIELPRPRPAHLGDYPSFNAYADRIHDVFRRFGVIKY